MKLNTTQVVSLILGWFILLLAKFDVAHAKVYPWLEDPNLEVILVDDAGIQFALRLWAIQRAKSSIDIATYTRDFSPTVGQPLLRAYRRAANQGITQRHLIAAQGSLTLDPLRFQITALNDPSLARRPEVLIWGLRSANNLHRFDKFHEKILIVDRGTPDELIFFGSANEASYDLGGLDFTWILRRRNPEQPSMIDQLLEHFDHCWSLAQKTQGHPRNQGFPYLPESFLKRQLHDDISTYLNNDVRRFWFSHLSQRIETPSSEPVSPWIAPLVFWPHRGRVLSHDVLNDAARGDLESHLEARIQQKSPIHTAFGNQIDQAQNQVTFFSMILMPPGHLIEKIQSSAKTGVQHSIYTNSNHDLKGRIPLGIPYAATQQGLDHLLSSLNTPTRQRLRISESNLKAPPLEKLQPGWLSTLSHQAGIPMTPETAEQEELFIPRFDHRKGAAVDHHVFATTDNFNLTSLARSNELGLQFEDPRLSEIFHRGLTLSTHPHALDCNEVLIGLQNSSALEKSLRRWIHSIGTHFF